MINTALITGASGGLGEAIAFELAHKGYDVALCARNAEKLNAVAEKIRQQTSKNAWVFPMDLGKDGAAQELYGKISEAGIKVSVLVNNAGFGDFGEFYQSDLKKQDDMVRLNCIALMDLSRMFIPEMVASGSGYVLNVASIAAFQPGPLMSIYYATKAFVLNASQAWAKELEKTGVSVTALCPGPISTGFVDAADLENSNLFHSLKVSSPEQVAKYAVKSMFKRKRVAIHGAVNKMLPFAERFAPTGLIMNVILKIQGRRNQ